MEQQVFFNVPINDFKLLLIDVVNDCLQFPPQDQSSPQTEIIDRDELCKRLAVSSPTIKRMEKKGKIPRLEIGSAIRYSWTAVLKSLENK